MLLIKLAHVSILYSHTTRSERWEIRVSQPILRMTQINGRDNSQSGVFWYHSMARSNGWSPGVIKRRRLTQRRIELEPLGF